MQPRILTLTLATAALVACSSPSTPDAAADVAPMDRTTMSEGGLDAGPDGGMDAVVGEGGGDGGGDPGALIAVSLDNRVGVLLEDFPAASRDRIAAALIARPQDFWLERARQQIRLTDVRLVFRGAYYPEGSGKSSLPLPPESQWNITLASAGPTRAMVDGHDTVVVPYTFRATLLSDAASPATSEPALAMVGGTWDEPFDWPVDPTLLLQRTGYACISEDQYPPQSVDAENAFLFYDYTCQAESPDSPVCHYTQPGPTESCAAALHRAIGMVSAPVHYQRLAWNAATAATVRVGTVTMPDNPDLAVLTSGLNVNRLIYRYIRPDDCAIADGCVTTPGWRRLLEFDSHDHNVGGRALHIGDVNYFVAPDAGTALSDHNVYEYSACHQHYHFTHYGDFSFGAGAGQRLHKNGFCLESTDRLSNNEYAPLNTPYSDCTFQGVESGWGDLYQAGLTCNWVDVTTVDTSAGPVTGPLTFHSNPDGFLCEGTPVLDDAGEQVWESTTFTTPTGGHVDRPVCRQNPAAEPNDTGTVTVTVPQRGGMVSTACTDHEVLGPRRNCELAMQPSMPACTPGAMVTLRCTGADATHPQVVRVCETSAVLGTGVDCTFQDALANVVAEAAPVTATFRCPDPRDAREPGGRFAIYTGPVFQPDGARPVVCTIQ